MKVLFVSSGNSKGFDIVPFIKEQGESLRRVGVDVSYFPIKGKGLSGYFKAIFELRSFLKKNHFDLIHGHFILSGFAALLGSRKIPVVLSLMGSDAYGEYVGENKVIFSSRYLTLLTLLIQPFVRAIISKSDNIAKYVYLKKKAYIIPNGIDVVKFKPAAEGFRKELKLDPSKKLVLFLGSKKSVRKNIKLVQDAIAMLNDADIELINPYPVAHDAIPKYLNSANVLAACSFMEGSPNVIKEAMACNCPIVSTDVGDVKWVFGQTEGCYITSFQHQDFAKKLQEALAFSQMHQRTTGEQRIKDLGLDAKSISLRVKEIYEIVLKQNK